MKRSFWSGPKHPEDCSDKMCNCGCHSAKNVKKNLNNNSTKQKYKHRLGRLFKRKQQGELLCEKEKV
jgi:hypothetical protein